MKKLDKQILADGESTGHAHRVNVDVFEEGNERYFEGPTIVTHEEHRLIPLEKKAWVSGIKQEYDHFAEEAKQVQD